MQLALFSASRLGGGFISLDAAARKIDVWWWWGLSMPSGLCKGF